MRSALVVGSVLAALVLLACGAQEPDTPAAGSATQQQVQQLQADVERLREQVEALQHGPDSAAVEAMEQLISELYARIQVLERANGIVAEGPGTHDCGEGHGEHASIVRDDYYVRGIQVC